MYSRATRKFLAPDADHANPNLGPGCYTADESGLFAGKSLGRDGYAPFASLTPRTSFFDDLIVRGPAPGAYAVEALRPAMHSPQRAPEFGRSQALRFSKITSATPGPGTYGTMDKVKEAKMVGLLLRGLEHGSRTHPLTKQPISDPSNAKRNDIAGAQGSERITLAAAAEAQISSTADAARTGGRDTDFSRPAVEGKFIPGGRKSAPPSAAGNKNKIMWRRKYGAPSIPCSRSAFGFQENEVGELVPRKPPKRTLDPGPAYNHLTSFAEDSKVHQKGYTFTASNPNTRLQFKVLDTPAPGVYENAKVQNYYRKSDSQNSAAVMTLAPCLRLTDEIVMDSKKRNVPGPGSYDVKAPIQEILSKKHGRVDIGAGSARKTYLDTEQTRTPGPGWYHPEFSEIQKPPAVKPQPFGSTTNRFENVSETKSKSAPAPGSYAVNEVDSMAHRIQKRANAVRAGAFGTISERFPTPKTSSVPGPASYDPVTPPPEPPHSSVSPHGDFGPSTAPAAGHRPPTRISRLMGQGPGHFQVGTVVVNPAKAHAPVFGTQSDRFTSGKGEIPPPGSYEIIQSFEALTSKRRIPKTSGMASGTEREIFPIKDRAPGPAEYEPLNLSKRDMRRVMVGGFLSTDERFKPAPDNAPGPGAYVSPDTNSGLLRKTYNITLTEWGRQQAAAAQPAHHSQEQSGITA
ncbi:hypothetical protein DFS34DRAFT_618740 [Phlyctochytrium arcticum]|nr:hypothetical protein DFS34DRAFT_618740 [Phlyctochytrium arcticum]